MKPTTLRSRLGRVPARGLGIVLVGLLLLPLIALVLSASPSDIVTGAADPLFGPALSLSLRTTMTSLVIVVVTGTPLAWWLSSTRSALARAIELVVDLPIVLPPAVMGVALLQTFGRNGMLGGLQELLGVSVAFSSSAVVIAQVVVAAPFYVQAAANAFRKVELDLLLVARTLGATQSEAFLRVAVPVALPGLVSGAALAWARALGEFGATLLFAGNLTGRTQTMPLAIYQALESDIRVALALSIVLATLAGVLLLALRAVPRLLARHRLTPDPVRGGTP